LDWLPSIRVAFSSKWLTLGENGSKMSGVSFHSLDEKVHGEGNLSDSWCIKANTLRFPGMKKEGVTSVNGADH
jgi:hypothetical protein